MNEKGSSTILVLTIVIVLTILSSGVFYLIQHSSKYIALNKKKDLEKMALIKKAERVVELLSLDNTPYSNAVTEKQALESSENGDFIITVADVSSRYNLNWIIGEELKSTGFLKSGANHYDFQSLRDQSGPLYDFSRYTDFVEAENIDRYFTPYNYFNINVSAELVLEKLYYIRTGDKDGASRFRDSIKTFRQKSKKGSIKMIEPEDIKEFMGEENYGRLYPVVNAQPVMNVHFIPEDILLILLRYFKVRESEKKANYLMSLREVSELSVDNLKQILGEEYYTKNRVHHYIGTITWFWEITIRKKDGEKNDYDLKWIITRIPQPVSEQEKEQIVYRLVKEEFAQ